MSLKGKIIAASVVLGVLLAGALTYWLVFTEPARPWVVKWRIDRYLKKQARTSDFKTDFKFPSASEMAKKPNSAAGEAGGDLTKGKLTGKDFDTLKDEYINLQLQVIELQRQIAASQAPSPRAATLTNQPPPPSDLAARQNALAAKEKSLQPILSDLWTFQRLWADAEQRGESIGTNELVQAQNRLTAEIRQKLREAETYEKMYRLIGQELWVVDRLLKSHNPDHRRVALNMVRQAAGDSVRAVEDSWLAARLIEAYVLPNLNLADASNRRSPLSLENLTNEAVDYFRRADETRNVRRIYELLLAGADTPQRADWARVQLSMVHEQDGNFSEALRYLKQVKGTNDFAWALRRVPRLEQLAKSQR